MKSKFKFSIVLIIAGLLVTLFACKREEVDFIGPGYISAPEGFAVISFTASAPSVDFTSGSVEFNAIFTHTVSWILTVTGQESGAVSIYKGIGIGITNLEWRGNHTEVIFFRKGEAVTATLSFYGTELTSSTTVTITEVPDFTNCGQGQFPLYGHFEDPSKVEPDYGPPLTYSPYYASFNFPNPIDNVVQGVDSIAVDYNGNLVPAVQGRKYYFIKGLGAQSTFVSGIQYYGALSPVLPSNAENVWVNIYLYGTGDANSAVEVEYQESDVGGSLPGYQGTDDDAFVARITLDHKGWKLFSFQYSKLTPSLNADFGGSGNKKHEPHRLLSFDLILIKKSNPDSPVEVYFDFPIITVGGPFKPCN